MNRLYKPFARKPWLTVYRAHAVYSNASGKCSSNMAGNYLYFWVVFLYRARDLQDRLRFRFVEPEIFICTFRFSKYDVPKQFSENVMSLPKC